MDWLYQAVARCDADTYLAYCFRRLYGIERRSAPKIDAKRPSDAYKGMGECFNQRHGVRM